MYLSHSLSLTSVFFFSYISDILFYFNFNPLFFSCHLFLGIFSFTFPFDLFYYSAIIFHVFSGKEREGKVIMKDGKSSLFDVTERKEVKEEIICIDGVSGCELTNAKEGKWG